ncbi:MAG TPA: T9SS type A sorting domain-containing protein, partial [bacterium]|nr:T9SS type A sorting domain-containing protein [bacterium]
PVTGIRSAHAWIADAAAAGRGSISNPSVCGADACDREDRIRWIDNDFRYIWESIKVPELPTAIQTPQSSHPVNLVLLQNSPNPFAEVTSLSYQLLHSGIVHIAIYDILGREIAVLLHQHKPAGRYEIAWNVRSGRFSALPNGVYFCRMRVDGQEQAVKMLLSRKHAQPQ